MRKPEQEGSHIILTDQDGRSVVVPTIPVKSWAGEYCGQSSDRQASPMMNF